MIGPWVNALPMILVSIFNFYFQSLTQWSTYFLAMSAFSFWGSFIFYKFGSGDLQSWAKLPVETEIDKEQNKHDRPTGSHDA